MKAEIESIKIEIVADETPDLSWLDQFENSNDPEEQEYYLRDQERKASYGDSWHMVGIRAEATIMIPFIVTTGKGKEINHKLETVTSGGLWSIESDSGKDYFKDVAKEELNDLKGYLRTLNVKIRSFESYADEAIENFEINL